jgi:hypothetical protein
MLRTKLKTKRDRPAAGDGGVGGYVAEGIHKHTKADVSPGTKKSRARNSEIPQHADH